VANVSIIWLAVASVVGALAATPSAANAWNEGDQNICPGRDLYDNSYYGFEVRIPKGLKGCPNSPVGMPDHGVQFRTSRGGTLDAFASFNALFHKNANDSADFELEVIQGEAIAGSVQMVSRQHTKLGGLDAVRLIAHYRRKTDQRAAVWDVTVAVRGEKGCQSSGSCPLEYAVLLSSDEAAYSADRIVLREVLMSWKAISESAI
jgi:hypothetical protein